MLILRLLKRRTNKPGDVEIVVDAYGEALRLTGITDQSTLPAEMLARRVISQFARGETDSKQIAKRAAEY